MMMLRNSVLAVIVVPLSASALFTDIDNSPYRRSIESLQSQGIIEGYSDGSYRPLTLVNRAEFTKLIVYSLGPPTASGLIEEPCNTRQLSVQDCASFTQNEEQVFPDVDLFMWKGKLNRVLQFAKDAGYIRGNPDGTFAPSRNVNFAEAAKIIAIANGYEPQGSQPWYEEYIDELYLRDAVPPSVYRPDQFLTREDIAEMLFRVKKPRALVLKTEGVCGNSIVEDGEQCDDGNTENDDGCSSICIIVEQPVRHASLRIDQRPAGNVLVSKGEKGISLLVFDAVAGRQDMFIHTVQFEAATGSLDSATNYQLYYDRSGDGTPDTRVQSAVPQSNILSFTDISIPVYEGQYTAVELRADIPSSGTLNNFSVQLALSQSDYIEGVGVVDGEDVTGIKTDNSDCMQESICWIAVYTQDPQLTGVGEKGNLYVTKESSSISSHQLLLGEMSPPLLGLQLRADSEDIDVTKFSFSGLTNSVARLELYREGQSEPFATAFQSACNAITDGMFCTAGADLIIERDDTIDVFIRALTYRDSAGGVSGETVALAMPASITGNVAIEAVGRLSNAELSQNNGDGTADGEIFIGRTNAGSNNPIEGPTHDLVGARFASIRNIHSDSDDSPVPTGLSTIGAFALYAEENDNTHLGENSINLRTVTFTVAAQNIEIQDGSFALLNPSNSSVGHSCSNNRTTGTITVTCSGLASASIATSIDSGDSLELALQAYIQDPQVDTGNSTLQVQLGNLGSRSGSSSIEWDDDVFPFDWVDVEENKVVSTVYRSN